MQGQVISDQFIIGDDGLYYRYNKSLTQNVAIGDIVSFEESDNIAINITFISKKPPKEEPKESVLEKIKNVDIEKLKNRDYQKIGFKKILNLFKFRKKDDKKETIFEEYESHLDDSFNGSEKNDKIDNNLENENKVKKIEKSQNSSKNDNRFVFTFNTGNDKDKDKNKNTKFPNYENFDKKTSSKNSIFGKMKDRKNNKKEKDFTIKDDMIKKPSKNQREIFIAKIIAIFSLLIPVLVVAIIFYLNYGSLDTSYKDMPLNTAILVLGSFLIMPIGTYIALKIISNLSGSIVHINYLKAIFYPLVLIFLFMFIFGLSNAFLVDLQSREILIIGNIALFVVLILLIIYCIKLQLRVFFQLARLTNVELFKLYAVLIVISVFLNSLPYLFGIFMVLLVMFGNFFINILPILNLISFASYFVGLLSFFIYLIAWVKVKNVKKAMFA
ncbi:sulfite exporter TauE/SafE family protein [Campylobacter ureolyticus]|uniref:sulfite exporter TauE/SafE family protein n=1 Tax=Campylobacter ureolyticus TaxID=827 RepID=UPI0022B43AAC|nr:sulfite exporter TauE/SafE family protein [Campylobacter ureolyticus]MCZ6172943.1 sulfite exporter TauE/SafE family protein [Campylobacter ureolyticus]